ncbi:hypothetical protein HPP92_000788 [Vanilla planifolia]|uniref:Expansin n=1 Tax=Vanilla planifolia TaxID=51239 RepID=A0A835S6F2_VANPL|nr:hypothetical protein HPP92_000933 [Vanilla planifolia]KAG0500716.1 hypothetical protein HPP92_000788 [Vanilla planifolia]
MSLVALFFLFNIVYGIVVAAADRVGWDTAHATFYGDMNANETMYGACGYGNLFEQGYGVETAALSTALFNSGSTCGACFELECYESKYCAQGSIRITATNFCPPNPAKPNDNGGWCNPPLKHFDLSMPMFVKITTDYHVGIVPVHFRRVPCVKRGGIRFQMQGNPWWILVLVYNVAGAGDVTAVSVKGEKTGWITMDRNWGQNWKTSYQLQGQSLSFQVTTSNGRSVQSINVAPANWKFGQTFQGSQFS